MTRLVAVPSAERLRECLSGTSVRAPSGYVERIGVAGRTLTVRDASSVFACDAAARARESAGTWCARAAGRLRRGRLDDPRLTLANCEDRDGRTVAFAWIEPPRGARWVAVHQDSYTEIYEPAGVLPIRVATATGVDVERSSVRMTVTAYRADGDELDKRELDLRVAS
ncbi:MAG: hypothetical protein ICV59_06375 [Thermoleophilia bacterium]|nr:hypothetical protein [Thermoleophilia bacterium]